MTLTDLVKGLYDIVKGVTTYIISGVVVVVTDPFGVTPQWANNEVDGAKTNK